jgi:hypothetical protein
VDTPPPYDPDCACPGRGIVVLSLLIALVGTAASLWLSLGMGLKGCPLCFYQRSFVIAAAGALLFGSGGKSGGERGLAMAIATFATAAGMGVAGFHVSLEMRGVLECPKGLFDIGTVPPQSLALFVVLFGALAAGSRGVHLKRFLLATVLGAVAAYGCIASAPSIVKPTKPYTDPVTICRPPFVAPV